MFGWLPRAGAGDIEHPFGQCWRLFSAGTAIQMAIDTLPEEVFNHRQGKSPPTSRIGDRMPASGGKSKGGQLWSEILLSIVEQVLTYPAPPGHILPGF